MPDFGSGHDLRVVRSLGSVRSLLKTLSLCPLPLPLPQANSLRKNKQSFLGHLIGSVGRAWDSRAWDSYFWGGEFKPKVGCRDYFL